MTTVPQSDVARNTERGARIPDRIDEQLIALLEQDGRASFAELGQIVDLSGDSVSQRVRRLTEDGTIKVVGSVSPGVLGYTTFALVAIEVDGPAQALADALAELPFTDFVACTAGSIDVLVEIVCRDDAELFEAMETLRATPGVRRCQTFVYLSVEKYTYAVRGFNGLGGPQNMLGGTPEAAHIGSSLDESDMALIRALQEDGRASYADLVGVTRLTYPSARRRVLRLISTGVVQINTQVNRLRAGSHVQAGVGVRVEGPTDEYIDRLRTIPQVGMVISTTGPFDLILEVTCTSKNELATLVGKTLRSFGGVVATETYNYLTIHKLPQTWANLT